MPRRNAKKSKRSRKSRTRKRTYKNSYSITKAPLPNTMYIKMRYQENIILDHDIAGIGAHVFSANGIADPNITGSGHQPRGYDQLMGTLYDHYIVLASKITCSFLSRSSSPNVNANVGIALKDNATTYLYANDYMEGRNQVFRSLEQSNPTGSKMLKKTFSAKKFFGRTDIKDNAELQGNLNDNPSEQAYYHIWYQAFSSVADPPTIDVNVLIDYIVVLREPRQPDQS